MSEQFLAEIRLFPFNFPPKGWAWCNGQIIPLSQNTALFALLGTVYGGDGKSTFALPNLQGSVAVHPGEGPGLSPYDLGQTGGSETVTLLSSEMPAHTHGKFANDSDASTSNPTGQMASKGLWDDGTSFGIVGAYSSTAPDTTMAPQALAPAGGGVPHNNMMPYQTVSFCIALQGVFPQRP